jgi:hypothetical protein
MQVLLFQPSEDFVEKLGLAFTARLKLLDEVKQVAYKLCSS